VALRLYQREMEDDEIPGSETLSTISGFSVDELDELKLTVLSVVNQETWLAAKSLIRNGILLKKGFSQFECSHDIMQHRRQKEEQESYKNHHFRRLFCSRSRSSFMLVNTVA
jgi:hypothetical protein